MELPIATECFIDIGSAIDGPLGETFVADIPLAPLSLRECAACGDVTATPDALYCEYCIRQKTDYYGFVHGVDVDDD